MNFGEIIRSFRTTNNMTQKELADKLSISPSTIGMYEQGRREPDLDTITKLADVFDISIDYLLGRENPDGDNSNYYINEETAKTAQEIFENRELRMLFDAARDADPEDLKALHNMALALKRKERGNTDDSGC